MVLALAVAATPLAAQMPTPATVPADSARAKAADRLAAVIAPDSDAPMVVEALLKGMVAQLLREDPEMADMEAEFPGLFKALTDAWRPILLKVARAARPQFRAELSLLYQANLTADEANEAADFLSQPDVSGYFAAVRSEVDFSVTLRDAMGDGAVRPASLRADVAQASAKSANYLTPELEQKLSTFFGSPVGRKLIALNPRKAEIEARWANYSAPGSENEIEIATFEAMLGHIAKTDPKLATAMRKQLEANGNLPKPPR